MYFTPASYALRANFRASNRVKDLGSRAVQNDEKQIFTKDEKTSFFQIEAL